MSYQVTVELGACDPQNPAFSIHIAESLLNEDGEILDDFSETSGDSDSAKDSESDESSEFDFEIADEEFNEDEYIELLLQVGYTDTIRVVQDDFDRILPSPEGNEDDDDDLEYALEEKEYIVGDEEDELVVTIRLSLSQDEEHSDFDWIETVNARCTLDGEDIGHAMGRFIDREAIRKSFWEDMDMATDLTANLAIKIFDRWGYLRSLFKDHPVQRGTGVWDDLDYGMLFLIEDVYVHNDYRRRGLGRLLAGSLLEKVEKHATYRGQGPDHFVEKLHGPVRWQRMSRLHALVMPQAVWYVSGQQQQEIAEFLRADDRELAMASVISFWRSIGFRRVGGSACFAFSFDPEHCSHAIPASEDFDPAPSQIDNKETEYSSEVDDASDTQDEEKEILMEKLPLHAAILMLDEADCVAFFERYQKSQPDKMGQYDSYGNTLLHVAASQVKPSIVEWILTNVEEGQRWKESRNHGGFTPFETLKELLEVARTRLTEGLILLNMSDFFQGFNSSAVNCLYLLEEDARKIGVLPSLHHLQLRYGCTCSQCLGGFISPRMKAALLFEANYQGPKLGLAMTMGKMWFKLHGKTIAYFDRKVQKAMRTDRLLRWVIKRIFLQVSVCLQANVVPRDSTIVTGVCGNQNWPAMRCRNVEENVQAVLMAVFTEARLKDVKAGDGSIEQLLGIELAELPTCRNDHEFTFVARLCGVRTDGI